MIEKISREQFWKRSFHNEHREEESRENNDLLILRKGIQAKIIFLEGKLWKSLCKISYYINNFEGQRFLSSVLNLFTSSQKSKSLKFPKKTTTRVEKKTKFFRKVINLWLIFFLYLNLKKRREIREKKLRDIRSKFKGQWCER